MPTTAVIAAGAASAGSAIYGASQSKDAADATLAAQGTASDAALAANEDAYAAQLAAYEDQAELLSTLQLQEIDPYQMFDIFGVANKAAGWNSTAGISRANTMAQQSNSAALKSTGAANAQAVNDVEAAMAQMFGGSEAFNAQRNATNSVVDSWLAGQVSQSTKDQLGRSALASGASDLGSGAVSDMYAGYLGLTTEGIVSQGVSAYQSLYSMYRQAVPITSAPVATAADMLQYTTLQPANAVQLEEYNRLNASNASMQAAELQFNADLAKITGQNLITGNIANSASQYAANTAAIAAGDAQATANYATTNAQANTQMVQGIASALGTAAGSYAGLSTGSAAYPSSTGIGYNSSGQAIYTSGSKIGQVIPQANIVT
jgi:hypothetical protein